MNEKVKLSELKNSFLHGGGLMSTFMRSTVTSQVSSWTDMLMAFVFFAWVGLEPWIATAIGAFIGGVVNCAMNYRFTYHADSLNIKAVAVKYILIWAGSLLLNTYGTQEFYNLLCRMTILEEWGFRPNGYFAAARLTVSLIVSVFWNFLMQKNFVYRPNSFDPYAVRFVDRLFHPTRSLV